MKVIESGKHTGKVLANCPVEYLEWASKHEKNFSRRNQWISRDAKIILERAKCPERKEKKMVKVLIETGSEEHTTSKASVIAKFAGGEHDGKMMYEVKQYIVGKPRWYDSNNKSKRWVETIFELPEGTKFEIIGRGQTGARGADKHAFHKVFVVDASVEVLETTIDVGLRDADLKGRVQVVKDVLAARKAAAEAARTEGF